MIVKGGYAGYGAPDPNERDPDKYVTVLDGDLQDDDDLGRNDHWENRDDNTRHVVTISNSTSRPTLDGVTIRGGECDAPPATQGGGISVIDGLLHLKQCTFVQNRAHAPENSTDHARGGGIWALRSDITINNCDFLTNHARSERSLSFGIGGALAASRSTVLIESSRFENNRAISNGKLYENAAKGAAVWAATSTDITMTDCTFESNLVRAYADNYETSAVSMGGAFYLTSSTASLTRCVFQENCADGGENTAVNGGAIYVWQDSDLRLSHCVLTENATESQGSENASALFVWESPVAIDNCVITGNDSSSSSSSAIYCGDCELTLTNSTVVSNRGVSVAIQSSDYGVLAQNCIFWNNGFNRTSHIEGDENYIQVNYSCLEGWHGEYTGVGNHGEDPRFVDPDGPIPYSTLDDDLRLLPGSPCIDSADNTVVPADITTDLNGNPRFLDDPETPDTGVGTPPIVDMGTYEYQADAIGVTPESFEVLFGAYLSGDVADLIDSDDMYLRVGQRAALAATLPLIRTRIDIDATRSDVEAIVMVLETATTALPGQPLQRVTLLNQVIHASEEVDSRIATFSDTSVEIVIRDASQYVEQGTNDMEMRLEYFDPGDVFSPAWGARVDQVLLWVVPQGS